MAQAAAAANRILGLRTISSDDGKPADRIERVEGGVEIEFKGVHFKYPTRPIPVFAGLNMKIERGQFAALVGPSGCGKTTTVSLLERFYDVQKGSITFDGKNISDLEIRAYRNSISLVAQEPTLYQGSIRENIMLAVDEGTVSEEDIHQACRDAEIHEFISSLPDGKTSLKTY
jgi:ATP-binding cassette, subfamily B (MDR/TAP), member 1